jgi:hypothetical protein
MTMLLGRQPTGKGDEPHRIPMQRYGKAQEIADVVILLASPGAGYITANLRVDGGITRSVKCAPPVCEREVSHTLSASGLLAGVLVLTICLTYKPRRNMSETTNTFRPLAQAQISSNGC